MGRKVRKIREMRWEGKEMRDRKGGKKGILEAVRGGGTDKRYGRGGRGN